MWGHYSDAERGFVIVYQSEDGFIEVNSPEQVFAATKNDGNEHFEWMGLFKLEKLELKRVVYRKRLPKVNAFHRLIPKFPYTESEEHYDVPLLLPSDAMEKKEDELGLVKYSSWKYEQELRAFFPTYGQEVQKDARIVTVSEQHFVGIVFGPRMSYADKHRAMVCCHLRQKQIPLCDAPNNCTKVRELALK